ncbi:M15 family metallopeptidase [Hydrogenophaga sp.]|uniref:M15 family metallopeptidase n=1 Tax=Hydrogenophaga sp. TaxID=1904254 RepID=UPI00286E34E2|nr:M15 family metallopeptidase [Hydrogenophaga sp.]
MIWVLGGYFVLVSTGLALVFLPGARSAALGGWRRGSDRLSHWVRQAQRAGQQGAAQAGGSGQRLGVTVVAWLARHVWVVLAALAVLVVLPLLAVGWRHWYQIETFDHTDVRIQDERIAALLAGERLTPPAPLPPEVFTTREVELARPMVRFASRDWALLDAEFAQRLLMVFRIMREQHGYEMVLIEGYRSPQRQEQLAAMGGHVTQAGAFRSYHQFGLAADSAFLRMGQVVISERDPWAMRGYELYGEVSASLGLTWGGGWKKLKDLGHVELRRPGVLRRATEEAPAVGYAF